jgi:3-dehydrosphinganine reductase
VLITGGSKGLGKALAVILADQGADITILARTPADLKQSAAEIQTHHSREDQRIEWVAADVADAEAAQKAVREATKKMGRCPDFLFACAGVSLPGIFVQQPASDFRRQVEVNYLGTVHVVQETTRQMVDAGVKGTVVMVASVLGLFGLIGYSSYVPTKFALRGLAEVLHQELKPYGINVHIMFPATILSPGFEQEQLRKPEITKLIEGADEGQTPESIAKALLLGVERGYTYITSDIIGHIARAYARGKTYCFSGIDQYFRNGAEQYLVIGLWNELFGIAHFPHLEVDCQ